MTDVPSDNSRPSAPRRIREWLDRHALIFYALALTTLLGLAAFAPSMMIVVPAGHVGVLWLRFLGGTVTDRVFGEGTHIISPWNHVTLYDVRLRNDTRVYETVSANSLAFKVEVAVRYRVNPPAAGFIHKLTGPDYTDSLVQPKISSIVYEMVSQYTPEEFYFFDRAKIQPSLLKRAREEFSAAPGRHASVPPDPNSIPQIPLILVEEVLVANITLPPLVSQAVERKIEQQQILQEYEFRVAREKKESERKHVEAEGIHDFQQIVARDITPDYLRLRGVEATQSFANSPYAKTIIIGGRDGLPVILNTGDDAKTPPPEATAAQKPHQPFQPPHTDPPALPLGDGMPGENAPAPTTPKH